MRHDARRRLRQLDAMDGIDALKRAVAVFRERGGTAPFTWQRLAPAGILRGIPHDPDGRRFALGPWTGDVSLGEVAAAAPARRGAPRPPAPRP